MPASAPAKSSSLARKTSSLRRDAAGEPAELCVIFPPNFEQAVARGKVMLVLEARWSGGRAPLNALPPNRAFAFSSADNAIIERLETLTNGETPALLQLELKDFAALLPLLAGHENLTLGKSGAVNVTRTPLALPLRATLETNGEITLALSGKPAAFTRVGDWVWQSQTLQPLGLPPLAQNIFQAPVRVPRLQVPLFLSQQWPQLLAAGGVTANFQPEDFSLAPQPPRFLLALKGGLAQLGALLQCAYGARILTPGVTSADEAVWLPDPEIPTRYSTRDFAAEQAALARLQRSGFSRPDARGRMQLAGQNAWYEVSHPQSVPPSTLSVHQFMPRVPKLAPVLPSYASRTRVTLKP